MLDLKITDMAKITKNLHELASKDKHRENMQHIIIDKGNFVVTDAQALLTQSLRLHDFTDDEISMLEGFCIHKDVFKELVKFDRLEVVDFGTIVGFRKGVKMSTFELKETKDLETKYPAYEAVIPDFEERLKSITESYMTSLANTLSDSYSDFNVENHPGLFEKLNGMLQSISGLASIGLNTELLNTLSKCMFGDVVKLRFIARDKAIGVEKFKDGESEPVSGQTAVSMPIFFKE